LGTITSANRPKLIDFAPQANRRLRVFAQPRPTAVIGRIEILQCSDLPPHSSLEGTD